MLNYKRKFASIYKIQSFSVISDISRVDSVEQLVSEINDLGLKVDILINNEGIAVNLPAGLVAFIMKLVLAKGKLLREIMRSTSGSESLKAESN